MRKLARIQLLILLVTLFSLTLADFEDIILKIESVSTSPDQVGTKWNSVSLAGGAYIYIKGVGFSTRSPMNNKVTLGTADVECPVIGKILCVNWLIPVAFLTTSTQVVCQAPPSNGEKTVAVKVVADDTRMDVCSRCLTYSYYSTPELAYMLPNAANPGDEILYNGRQRVTSSLDIDYIKIGDHRCDANDQNEFDSVTFEPHDFASAPCNVPNIEAGYYTVTQKNLQSTGLAKKLMTLPVHRIGADPYDFAVIPSIDSISQNEGSSEGQILTIIGKGFSAYGQNEVKLADTSCVILEQSQTQITCELQPRTSPILSQAYHTGLKFEVYGNDSTISSVRNGAAGTPTNKTIRLVAETPINAGDLYTSKLSGYFKAPVTGTYKFVVTADDEAELYISNTPLDRSNLVKIIDVTRNTPYKFFFANPSTQISDGVDLEANNLYYMELYHNEVNGGDFATVGVHIPNSPNDASVRPEVRSIKVNCPYDPEIWEFRLSNVIGGTWNIKVEYYDSVARKIVKTLQTVDMSYDVSNRTLADQLYINVGYITTEVKKKMLRADGTETTTRSEATTFVYQATFLGVRTNGKPLVIQGGNLQGSSVTSSSSQIQAPSSTSVRGTFTVKRGVKTAQFKYNSYTWEVESNMRALGFKDPIRVSQIGAAELGAEWRIQFSGENGDPLDPFIVEHSLDGCKNPSAISVSVTNLQDASHDLFYETIPSQYLFTAEDDPQITVKSNGITASCPNRNCNYIPQTTNLPEVVSASYSAPTLTLSITHVPTAITYSTSTVRVFLGNVECSVTSYTESSSTASILANCATPEAGDHNPKVHFNRFGYAKINSGVPKISIAATITSITPFQINSNGGTTLNINGRGFPISTQVAQNRGLVLKIGTSDCTPIAVTPTQIQCLTTPVAASAPLTLTLNSKTATSSTLSLLTAVPTISAVNPSAVNPVLQTTITISGNNFDSNIANTKIFLGTAANPQVQECLPISSGTSQITCKLLGAPTGTYNLYAQTSLGFTNSRILEVKTVINSIAPSSGSTAGGTILTIQGGSFSDDAQQTLVFIGGQNVMCDVISSSSTVVRCKTRAKDVSYTSNSPQDVVVATRIVEESLCENGGNPCSFTYSDALTPEVTALSATTVIPGSTLQINGTGFDSTYASTPVVTIDGLSCTVSSSTATQIVVTIPGNAVPNKQAELVVNVDGKGNAKFTSIQKIVQVTPAISSISPTSGSTAGVLLTLVGSGFQTGAKVNVGTSSCAIQSLTSTNIVCLATSAGEVSFSFKDFSSVKCRNSCFLSLDTTKTPSVTSVSPQSPSSPSFTLTVQGTQFNLGTATVKLVAQADSTVLFGGTITSSSGTQVVASFSDVAAGTYVLQLVSGSNVASSTATVTVPLSTISGSAIQSSIAGGATLTISGSGFFDNANKDKNKVAVCGLPCQVTQSSGSSIECQTPLFVNSAVKTTYPNIVTASVLESRKTWSDNKTESTVYDLAFTTTYKSTQANCIIGFDIGLGLLAQVSEIKFFPDPAITASTLKNTVIEGSNDNSTYTNIATIDANAHDGWNTITLGTAPRYRYYRLRGATSTAKCALAELQYYGIVLSDNTATDLNAINCKASVTVNDNTQETASAVVNYKQTNTPVLTSISPDMGTSAGGTTLTLTGTGFPSNPSQVKVYVDDVECTVQTATSTQLICLTGAAPSISNRRSSLESELKIISTTQGNAIVNNIKYFYVDRWSDISTWGGITPPRAGESVSIPSGQTILLDISPPKLKAIIIEGALIFDDANIDLDCDYIIIRGGRMQVGTWEKPIQNKITITLHGTKESPQLPIFGNKVIAMMEGILDIHGKPRSHSWTLLDRTADVGATSIVVQGAVDWVAGEQIVVASTEHDHYQSEARTIATVTQNSPSAGLSTITFTDAFQYRHYAGVQTIDGVTFEMRAEVGLLTRNVVIQGDEDSTKMLYGVHIMSHSSTGDDSSIGRISYTEVRRAGQAYNLGRYPIHFHLIGNVRQSYVIGNAIHHTFNRAVTIHGVHFLKVQKNFAYWCMGHNIFIEDGIETHNVIEDNLVMNTIASTALLNTDQTPASFWITNPNNIWRRNHAAGSDRYGFWFDLRAHPEGPSATDSICPIGEKLGEFVDNQAHSSGRYGLRIFHELVPRTYPCLPFDDPVANPPIQAEFKNFFGWKNRRSAIIGEKLGAIKFKNIKAADNLRAGIEISDGNRSPPDTLLVEDAWIVGVTPENGGNVSLYIEHQIKGLITPKVDFFVAKNVHFSNFGTQMTAIETCSHCEHPAATEAGARTSFFEGLTFNNVSQRVRFNFPLKEILVDRDGSLTGNTAGGKGVVTFYYDHLNVPGCHRDETVYNGLVCDETVTIRRVELMKLVPFESFLMQNISVVRVQDNPLGIASGIPFREKHNESWAIPLVTGYSYNLSWVSRADFTSMSVRPSEVIQATDKSITLIFNHSEYRETYSVIKNATGQLIDNSTTLWDVTTADSKNCGDWYHDSLNQLLYILINGKQKNNLELKAFKCKDSCPVVGAPTAKDNLIRLWSNPSIWPNSQVPKDGEDVEVPGSWVIKLDVSTAKLGTLTVKGDLYFDDTKDKLVLTAQKIWVQGNVYIGNNTNQRYTKNARIVLTGFRKTENLIIGSGQDAGNKVLTVTGNLTMYGALIDKHYVRLLAPAAPQDSTITVPADSNWKVGDEIVIAPSQRAHNEFETRKITAISNGVITLDQPLSYYHFGAQTVTKVTNAGTLDMRTEVGLLTRNIVIEGTDEDSWGGRVYVAEIYSESEDYYYRGRVDIDGVEMRNLGQANSTFAGLTFDTLSTTNNGASAVRRSVVRDSLAWHLRVIASNNITFEQNVFYKSYKYQVTFEGTNKNIKFNNNLGVANLERGLTFDKGDTALDFTVMFFAKDEFVNSQVFGNIFAGCQRNCLVSLGGTDCSSQSEGPFTFYNNTAHSSETGWDVAPASSKCNHASHFTGYKLEQGITSFFRSEQLKASYLIITDTEVGISLNTAIVSESVITLQKSYVAGLSLPIYDNKTECSNLTGVFISVGTTTGKSLPPMMAALPWYKVKSDHIFLVNFIVKEITFENFKDEMITGCTSNFMFKPNPTAADSSAVTNVSSLTLVNVDTKNKVQFTKAENEWIGVDNCGGYLCTGLQNILIRDLDGTLIGQPSSIFPTNPPILDSSTCVVDEKQNAHICNQKQWGVLTFDSLDGDTYTRLISPVKVTSDGYENTLNSYMDHIWDGFYTGLKRLSRFHSVVQSQKAYKVSFTGTVPNGMRWQLQGALPTESVTVEYGYTKPQSVIVTNKDGTEIKPYVAKTAAEKVILDSHPCGTNIYNLQTKKITLKLTGEESCRLSVTIINSISASIRYAVTVEEFFSQNGPAKFVDMVAAILKINPASIRVVDITSGSSIVSFSILSSHQGNDANTLAAAKTELEGHIETLNIEKEKGNLNLLNYQILDSSFDITLQRSEGAENGTVSTIASDGSTIYIIVACVVAGIALIAGGFFAYLRYRRRRAMNLKVMDLKRIPTHSTLMNKTPEAYNNVPDSPLMQTRSVSVGSPSVINPILITDGQNSPIKKNEDIVFEEIANA